MAAVLVASLLPTAAAPALRAASDVSASYADWLRGQLAEPAGEAFEAALQTALQAEASSISAFLDAFVEAYEAQRPEVRLAHLLSVHDDLSNEALLLHLRGRFNRLVGAALLPHAALIAAQGHGANGQGRSLVLLALPALGWPSLPRISGQAPVGGDLLVFILSVRTLWAAQPLGP